MPGSVVTHSAMMILVAGLSAVARATPLLHYSFDDQTDPTANLGSLGAGQNGDLRGDAQYVPFEGGHAGQLDGSDGSGDWVIPIGSNAAFNIADGDFSLFARIVTTNLEPGSGSSRFIMTKEHIGRDPGFVFSVRRDTGHAQVGVSDGTLSVNVFSRTPVNDGAAHDILGVRQDDRLFLYVDGCLHATAEIPPEFGSTHSNEQLVIGGRTNAPPGPTGGPNDDFIGIIDEVQIFDYALTLAPCPAVTSWTLSCLALATLAIGVVLIRLRAHRL